MSESEQPRHLLILSPPGGKPLQFELKGKRVGLGRAPDNHIRVDFGQVSGSHLEFEFEGEGYLIRDLNSTNGVTLNGERVTGPAKVKDGDRLMIGRTIPAHYLVVAAGEKATAAASYSSEKEQEQAAAFTSMDEKIQKLEGEAHELEAQIAALKKDYDETKVEHDKALEGMRSAEEKLREKESAGAAEHELDALQSELLEQTRRFKVLASDLDGQKQQIDQLQRTPELALPAQPLKPSSPSAPQVASPVKPSFATPAPVSSPPAAAPSPATSPPIVQPSDAPSPATSPPIQIAAAAAPPTPAAPVTPVTPVTPAAPVAVTPAEEASPVQESPPPRAVPTQPASKLTPSGTALQVPGAGAEGRAKLQLPEGTKAPAKPTMKLGSEGADKPKRPGLNVPRKPPGEGPKTVNLG